MNRKEIQEKIDELEKLSEEIESQSKNAGVVQGALIAFMKANKLTELEVDGMKFVLEKEEEK